jgi:nicotinate (nicotinamide) nucleotide adenylyltransferase
MSTVRFLHRAGGSPRKLGILAGGFNPPTRAHAGLIEAAAAHVDEILCVVPLVFPHKVYHGASLEQRLQMLEAIRPPAVPCSIGVSERGLFIEIARECRLEYGTGVQLFFLCGRDAAERIIGWDYGEPRAIERMLDEFSLLVAARQGRYEAPGHLAHCIGELPVARDLDEISSTEVRERIRGGQAWEHLVPPAIHDEVRRIYR